THYFGSKDYDAAATLDRDYDSWAGMMQVGANISGLTPSLMYFYAQGQDMGATAANGGDLENALATSGTGDMFEPLYILTGRHTGMLNNDIFSGHTGGLSTAGVHAVVAAADYAVSNQLRLHGAIGWAKADEVQAAGQDDAYGWEYNVGAAYKLLDNLTYEAHFGYLDTGDFFNGAGNSPDITKNIYILTHSLTMTF
ncbi:MAG: porin, partial [Desulfurivibrionaceae bacterium]